MCVAAATWGSCCVSVFAASPAPGGEVSCSWTHCRPEGRAYSRGVFCVAQALAALRAEAGVVVEGCDLEDLSPVPGGLLCEFVLTVICPWDVGSTPQTDPDSTSQVSAPCDSSLIQYSKSPWGKYFKDSDLEFLKFLCIWWPSFM